MENFNQLINFAAGFMSCLLLILGYAISYENDSEKPIKRNKKSDNLNIVYHSDVNVNTLGESDLSNLVKNVLAELAKEEFPNNSEGELVNPKLPSGNYSLKMKINIDLKKEPS